MEECPHIGSFPNSNWFCGSTLQAGIVSLTLEGNKKCFPPVWFPFASGASWQHRWDHKMWILREEKLRISPQKIHCYYFPTSCFSIFYPWQLFFWRVSLCWHPESIKKKYSWLFFLESKKNKVFIIFSFTEFYGMPIETVSFC